MKASKLLAIVSMMVFAMIGSALAGDKTYKVKMTGVTWAGCKTSVSSAFTSLGATSVKIEKGKEAGTQMVTVVCPADKKFTKEAAIKSLGSKASRFVVKDVKEAKGKGGKKKEKEKAS